MSVEFILPVLLYTPPAGVQREKFVPEQVIGCLSRQSSEEGVARRVCRFRAENLLLIESMREVWNEVAPIVCQDNFHSEETRNLFFCALGLKIMCLPTDKALPWVKIAHIVNQLYIQGRRHGQVGQSLRDSAAVVNFIAAKLLLNDPSIRTRAEGLAILDTPIPLVGLSEEEGGETLVAYTQLCYLASGLSLSPFWDPRKGLAGLHVTLLREGPLFANGAFGPRFYGTSAKEVARVGTESIFGWGVSCYQKEKKGAAPIIITGVDEIQERVFFADPAGDLSKTYTTSYERFVERIHTLDGRVSSTLSAEEKARAIYFLKGDKRHARII